MSLKILVVDDNPGEVRFLQSFFVRHPAFSDYVLKVLEAADGEEGLDLFIAERPDVVLVDLLLPKIDGMTLCKEIRSRQGERAVGVLAISSIYRDAETASELREQLGVELLTKPLDLKQLPGKVSALLRQQQEADAKASRRWATPTVASAPVGSPVREGTTPSSGPASIPEAASGLAGESSAPLDAEPAGVALDPQAGGAFDFDSRSRGKLEEGLLARLLVAAADSCATGTLRVSRGKVRKVIYLRQGRPVFVDSNVRNETLGAYLLGRQMIGQQQLAEAIQQARSDNSKLGEALVALGILDDQTVAASLLAQVELKLATALRWCYGAYDFVPGDDVAAQVPSYPVDGVRLVLAAMQRLSSTDDLAARLGPVLDLVPRLAAVGVRQRSRVEDAFGPRLLQLLDAGASLRQLVEQSGDGAVAMSCVAALQDSGLLEFHEGEAPLAVDGRDADSIAVEDDAEQPWSPPVESSVGVELRHLDPTRRSTPGDVTAPDITTDRLYGGSGLALLSEHQAPQPQEEPCEPIPQQASAPQVIELDDDRPTATLAPPDEAGDEELLGWLGDVAATGSEKTFYELLEVCTDASEQDLVGAHSRLDQRCESIQTILGDAGPEAELCVQVRQLLGSARATLCDPEQRQRYDQRLTAACSIQEPGRHDTFGAEIYFQQGRTMLQTGQAAEAVEAFRKAVEMNPEQPDYQASLGWALFLQRGRGEAGAMAARSLFQVALGLSPDSAQVHELASRVEEDAHEHARAAWHLTMALKFGPARLDLFERLKALLFHLADYGELERLYRNMIFRLRDRDPQSTGSLWVDLARLYSDKLAQPDNARLALRVAEKLVPGDPRLIELRASVDAEAGADWQHAAAEARREALEKPGDPDPLHRLLALSQRARQFSAVLAAGGVLAAQGQATPEELAVVESLRPRQLKSREAPIPMEALQAVRHDSDRPSMERLVAELSPLLCQAYGIPLESLGSGEDLACPPERLPAALSAALSHAATALEVGAPSIYLSRTLPGVVPRPGSEGALLVHESLWTEMDVRLLAFLFGRALSCLGPGRRHVFARPGNDIKTTILAALAACQPGMPLASTDSGVSTLREQIVDDEDLLGRLTGRVGEVLSEASRLNLSDWMRGIAHTSARVGLLVCGDVLAALCQLQGEASTAKDVTALALSDAGAALLDPQP